MKDEYIARYKYAGDGCVYFLNAETRKIQKICDVTRPEDIPEEVYEYFNDISQMLGDAIKGR
jgi:hypothetical protein